MNYDKLDDALASYRETLRENGSATAEVIVSGERGLIERLNKLENVSVPDALERFYLFIGQYDSDRVHELDIYEPHFAWGMYLVPLRLVATHYNDSAGCGGVENPDYWPMGFLPILEDGSGSYVVVNCVADSPTYGGVYDMSEGVGCNLISKSILEFIKSSEKELKKKLECSRVQTFPKSQILIRT
jgi:hypothetical protein